jgi:alpha-ketoglutarate-dependent taurine dioxygenase
MKTSKDMYDHITVAPVTPAIGAEIGGVDLALPLGSDVRREIHTALMRHQVVFFRDQDISPGASGGRVKRLSSCWKTRRKCRC